MHRRGKPKLKACTIEQVQYSNWNIAYAHDQLGKNSSECVEQENWIERVTKIDLNFFFFLNKKNVYITVTNVYVGNSLWMYPNSYMLPMKSGIREPIFKWDRIKGLILRHLNAYCDCRNARAAAMHEMNLVHSG